MEALLRDLNHVLLRVSKELEGPLKHQRLEQLQSADLLPEKSANSLASESIDLMDRITRMLQPPSSILAESFLAYIDTKCLWAAVSNDIPDKVSAGQNRVDEIATLSGIKPACLRQVMRVLCSNGIFQHDSSADTYHHTSASRLLVKDHWTQWHNWTDLYGNEFYDICRSLPEAIKTGETRSAAQIQYNTDQNIFQYFSQQGLHEKFHRTLGGAAIAQAPGIIHDYDWRSVDETTILDIGGGAGDFIAALLREHPKMTGALLELESIVDVAKRNFHGPGAKYADVGSRLLDFHIGDFTKEVPAYEVYIMKWCLHNWNDHDVVQIMSNIRKAIKISAISRFVIIDSILSESRSGRVTRYGDITMMVAVNGNERTAQEWSSLAIRGGWRVDRIFPLRNAWCSAIELRPVSH